MTLYAPRGGFSRHSEWLALFKTGCPVCKRIKPKQSSVYFPQDKVQKSTNSTVCTELALQKPMHGVLQGYYMWLFWLEGLLCLSLALLSLLSVSLHFEACYAGGCCLCQQQSECWWMSAQITCDWSHCLSPLKFNPGVVRRVKEGIFTYSDH